MNNKGSLRWGRIQTIHPEDYSLDLTMTDDGSQLSGVQVLTPWGSSSSGETLLIQPSASPNGNKWDLVQSRETEVEAAVAFFGTMPVVIGFRYPQICQMLFEDLQRAINRHPSDFYTNITGTADFEAYHPSGTYFRIGSSPAHEDLTGKNFDQSWVIANNTKSAPYVNLTVANAGNVVANIQIDPQGDMKITLNGNLTANVTGNVAATIQGAVTANVTGNVDITSPQTTIHGNLIVTGTISGQETISSTGNISTQGAIEAAGDVSASNGTITMLQHYHQAQGATADTTVAKQ